MMENPEIPKQNYAYDYFPTSPESYNQRSYGIQNIEYFQGCIFSRREIMSTKNSFLFMMNTQQGFFFQDKQGIL